MKRILIIAAILAAASNESNAQSFPEGTRIGINIVSIHTQPGMNNINPGIYVILPSGYGGGVFYNSFKRLSIHVDKTWCVSDEPANPCLTVGAVTGYQENWNGHAISPLIVPSVKIRSVRISGIIGRKSTGVHFAYEF